MIASRLDVSENRITFLKMAMRTKVNPTFGTKRAERDSRIRGAGVGGRAG